MSPGENREYVLGTNEAEVVRLGVQHKLWSAAAFAIWERAGFRAGQTVLDIGCGPGYTSFDLAGLVKPNGRVVAIDESSRFIDELDRRKRSLADTTIEAIVGDVQSLDLENDSFDAAYQRWVLCFVRDPEAVIRGVAAALKPGGVFAIQEYLHYEGIVLAPASKPFRRFIEVVAHAWRSQGGDTEVGQRLPALLAKNGMEIVEISPLHRVARPQSQLWKWPSIFVDTYGRKLVEDGRLTPGEHEALIEDWETHSNDPNAFFVSPPMVDIIAVKQ
jgi:ubiquinone/menaquinone biosynthesis C-methylase UbiE